MHVSFHWGIRHCPEDPKMGKEVLYRIGYPSEFHTSTGLKGSLSTA